ncbi:MAG: cellulase family glycosylhydrolase [Mycobacteriaceae bacterium]
MMYLPDSQLAREFDAVKASGATWIRVDVDWSDVEATRGHMDWANTDRVVKAARSRGLLVLAAIVYTPRWAQDDSVSGKDTHGRPANPELFATFAAQAATRYGKDVTSWEIWNEPNLAIFFAPRPDAVFYTRMLQASYRSIHAVQPTATVIGGSLAPANDSADGSTVPPTTFAEQMYAAGAKDTMDAVSIHPYSYPANPSDSSTAAWNTFYRLRYVRDTMQHYGDGTKALWLTEFGSPTATVETGTGPVTVDDQRQAQIISDGLRYANLLPAIGPVFIYSIRDEQTGSPITLLNFGVLRTDYSPKPSYDAIKQYTGVR